ncbi:MAG TPA: exosortase K [Cytophagales bacterium]|nr:exosortase K [Cytophagales bacterium]
MKQHFKSPRYINLFFYTAILLIAFLLKTFFSRATPDDLNFILYPTTSAVNAITGNSFEFISGTGYVMEGTLVVINKTCSGGNFFIIAFSMAAFMGVAAFSHFRDKAILLVGSLLSSFILTVTVNGFRISLAIFLLNRFPSSNLISSGLSHQLQGVLFYFSFLLGYYLSVKWLLERLSGHNLEKNLLYSILPPFVLSKHPSIGTER